MSIEDDIRKKLEDEKKPTGELDTYPSLKDSVYEKLSVSPKNEKDDVDIIPLKMDTEMSKNMKFLSIVCKIFGILLIVLGVMYCLLIIGAIIGVPFIFIGLKVYQAGDNLEQAVIKKDEENFRLAIIHAAKSVKYYLIFLLTFIILSFGTFIFILMIGIFSDIVS